MTSNRYIVENYFKEELRVLALQTRNDLGFTQRQMSEKLYMSESSYSNIETGRSGCSMVTAILLLNMKSNADVYLSSIIKKFEEEYELERHFI